MVEALSVSKSEFVSMVLGLCYKCVCVCVCVCAALHYCISVCVCVQHYTVLVCVCVCVQHYTS